MPYGERLAVFASACRSVSTSLPGSREEARAGIEVGARSPVIVCPGCDGALEPDCTVYGRTVPTGDAPAAPEPVDGELNDPVDCAAAEHAIAHKAIGTQERKQVIFDSSSRPIVGRSYAQAEADGRRSHCRCAPTRHSLPSTRLSGT